MLPDRRLSEPGKRISFASGRPGLWGGRVYVRFEWHKLKLNSSGCESI